MSDFTHGFNHGFCYGMFNRMFGGFGMFNWCGWNSAPTFLTPSYNFGNFFNYQAPMPMSMAPSLFNYSTPSFTNMNSNMAWQSYNYSMPDFSSTFNWDSTFFSNKKEEKVYEDETSVIPQTDGDFDKMLDFVLSAEGGYNPDDCGQAGNKGVQQSTYDNYRKKKGLSTRNVKDITNAEVKDLYYTMFYKASGADKIKDARMALYVFDSAVNMGVGAAKELYKASNNDLDKFEDLRIARYESIAAQNDGEKQKYLKGWKNRVAKAETYANKEFVA